MSIQILLCAILISLTGCKTADIRRDGEYVHRFKGGHTQIIAFTGDSTLYFVNNVSIMGFEVHIPYEVEHDKIIVSQNSRDSLHPTQQLAYPGEVIDIKNPRKLILDNKVFKFRKRITIFE